MEFYRKVRTDIQKNIEENDKLTLFLGCRVQYTIDGLCCSLTALYRPLMGSFSCCVCFYV